MRRALAVALVLALTAALGLHSHRAMQRLKVSRTLKAVEEITQNQAATGRVRADVLWRHVEILEQAERVDPVLAALPLARGSHYLLLKRPREATEAYERALSLEVRPEIYLNLGRAQLMAGDADAARRSFEAVRKLDPILARRLPAGFDPEPTPGRLNTP